MWIPFSLIFFCHLYCFLSIFDIYHLFLVGSVFFHLFVSMDISSHIDHNTCFLSQFDNACLSVSHFLFRLSVFDLCSMLFVGSFFNICFLDQYVVACYPQSHVTWFQFNNIWYATSFMARCQISPPSHSHAFQWIPTCGVNFHQIKRVCKIQRVFEHV